MPKITKKKKEKAADFSKAKLKLGKGKQVANNATDTSYKARSIALPTQQPLLRSLPVLGRDSDSHPHASSSTTPTSSRGLTLSEILPLLRHPNAGNRKDALGELKEVLAGGGGRDRIGEVLGNVGRMIGDDESPVRKALLSFLGWYLPHLPNRALPPHIPLLLLQTASALSHIFPEIRLDACRLISLLLTIAPDEVVGNWPHSAVTSGNSTAHGVNQIGTAVENTILEGLRLAAGIGGKTGEGGHNGQSLLPTSKLVVLRALEGFARASLRKQGLLEGTFSGLALAGLNESQGGRAKEFTFPAEVFARFNPIGFGRTRSVLETRLKQARRGDRSRRGEEEINLADWQQKTDVLSGYTVDGWLVGRGQNLDEEQVGWSFTDLAVNANQSQDVVDEAIVSLYLSLYPLLLSIILEAAPAAFTHAAMDAFQTSSTTDVNMQLCSVVLDITVTLAGRILSFSESGSSRHVTNIRPAVSTIVDKMSPYFPFNSGFGNESSTAGQTASSPMADHLCVSFATIVTLLAPSPSTLPPRIKSTNPKAHLALMDQAFAKVAASRTKKDKFALNNVAGWLEEILTNDKTDALQQTISAQMFVMVVPIALCLIAMSSMSATDDDPSIPERVLTAVINITMSSSSATVMRRLGNEFIMRLLLLNDESLPSLPFYIPSNSPIRPLLLNWLESLPRVLWELQTKDLHHTELIINYLHHVAQQGSNLFSDAEIDKVEQRLIPFFHLQHNVKGSIPGPWAKLPSVVLKKQSLAMVTVRNSGEGLMEAVTRAVNCV